MRFFQKSLLVALAFSSLIMSGCETMKSADATNGTEPVAVTGNAAAPQPMSDAQLKTLTTRYAGGSVEVYDLEGELPAPYAPASEEPYGVSLSSTQGVTIYPLDGGSPVFGNAVSMIPTPSAFGEDESGKMGARVNPNVSSVYFPHGSAQLSRSDRSALNSVAETAKFAPLDRVSVEGHASSKAQTSDPVKAKILNLKESLKRATAVSEDLIEKGVPAEKIKTVGWGDTLPMGANEADQRRVDIVTGFGQ